jgi:hypothetical protein
LLDDLPNVNFHKLVSDILGDIFDDIDGDIWKLQWEYLVSKYANTVHSYANIFYKDSDGLISKLTIVNWLYQILHIMQSKISSDE